MAKGVWCVMAWPLVWPVNDDARSSFPLILVLIVRDFSSGFIIWCCVENLIFLSTYVVLPSFHIYSISSRRRFFFFFFFSTTSWEKKTKPDPGISLCLSLLLFLFAWEIFFLSWRWWDSCCDLRDLSRLMKYERWDRDRRCERFGWHHLWNVCRRA